MKKIYEIYSIETGYPTVGVTDNPVKVIYESYKKTIKRLKEKDNFFTDWTINGNWETFPLYRNVVDFYKECERKRGYPALDNSNRRWNFKEIKTY